MDIKPNLHQLELFLLVAKDTSFSKAAADLGTSQPSISIQIKKLEQSLGVKLFDRLGRNVYLTAEGRLVLNYAKRLFGLFSSLQSDLGDVRDIRAGNLLVGASGVPSSTTFPTAFALFKKQYPETNIVVNTALSGQVEQWVLENEVDLGLIGGDVTSKFIVTEHYYDEELVAVLPREHRLAKAMRISPIDLLSDPFLLPYTGRVAKLIERAFQTQGANITQYVVLGSREAVKAALAAGYGVSIMPRSAVDLESSAGLIVTKKIYGVDLKYPVNIIFHKDKHLSRLGLSFLEFLRKLRHPAAISRATQLTRSRRV
jgi:DNA-binding transcriptional LysR family regulator